MVVKKVSFSYKSGEVLREINAVFKEGKICCIAGHNGSGKTTFLRVCLGLLTPLKGRIASNKKLGYMPEKNGFFQNLTVKQNVDFFKKINNSQIEAGDLLSEWGLENDKDKVAGKLSSGQQKRVSFLITYIQNADILFLDEPTSAMDIATQKIFISKIKLLKAAKKTIVITTHDTNIIKELCDEIMILKDGQQVLYGNYSEPQKFTELYLNSYMESNRV